MKKISLMLLLALFASPLSAQKSDKKTVKGNEKTKESGDGMMRDRRAGVRTPTMRKIQAPPSKKSMVDKYLAVAAKDVSALGLKGKTAKTYTKGIEELAEQEHKILSDAVVRRDLIVSEMAKELSKLTKKKFRDLPRRQLLLLYGAALMRPEQYRALREGRDGNYERSNAFITLVEETGKPLEDVKETVTTIRTLIVEDNPWQAYRKVSEARSAFNGTLKNMFTPEEYFKYLQVKGIDKAPKSAKIDGNYRKALAKLTLTEGQETRVKKILRDKKMDDEIKRDKINDLLNKTQRETLKSLTSKKKDGKSKK